MGFALRHRDSELAFFKPVLTLLIITVVIRELLQPYMICSVSYGEYCQGNINEGWQLPLQQPSEVLEPRLRPEALSAQQGDPVGAMSKDAAQSHVAAHAHLYTGHSKVVWGEQLCPSWAICPKPISCPWLLDHCTS